MSSTSTIVTMPDGTELSTAGADLPDVVNAHPEILGIGGPSGDPVAMAAGNHVEEIRQEEVRPMRRYLVSVVLLIVALTGCTPNARPAVPDQPPVAQPTSSPDSERSSPAAPVSAPPAPTAPLAKSPRLLVPDPVGQYIADVDVHLRIRDYDGQTITAPEFSDDPVVQVVWSPRGDFLLVITGKPIPECCDLFQNARYWILPVPQGTPRELKGLPQGVVFTWSDQETSLYVLDNWRRQTSPNEMGERVQRYDVGKEQVTLLVDRHSRLTSVAELPGGDLLVGQYAGGGHGFYYRLPVGSDQLVAAAPFHMALSPDKHWAVETNLYSRRELAIADVQTGQVTNYTPNPRWPAAGEKGLRISDPVWAEDSRWLMYTVSGSGQVPVELRFFDRKQAEPDRIIPQAQGVWLPGPVPEALVFRFADGTAQPWRYDVATGRMMQPVGPKAPASGGTPGDCEPVRDIRVSAGANTAAYLTCDKAVHSLWIIDLTGRVAPLAIAVDRDTWLLSLSAEGRSVALSVLSGKDGRVLRLEKSPRQ